ncbi:restriction endonuclease subunit S [Acidovorax sp. SDU_ACID1]|uniref:restriction endonuclease subunit S n=1 Tax=Acidovorax sp. SDU_ACID1 TaxID=3136632 RepID=UPI003873A946
MEWLGKIPSHWSVRPLKRALRLLTEKADRRSNPVALENIESWSGRFIPTETELVGDGIAFERGDILFGKLRPYLAKVLLAESSGEAVGDFHVMHPAIDVLPRFAQYQLLEHTFIDIVDGSTFGSKMPRASWEFVGSMPLATPLLEEQTAIATFLDRETAKIDALIAEQEKLIALLAEKRQATISHAVTKGLNPNAPMKDSGVAWLGEVPERWEVKRMKHLVRESIAGPYGSSLTKSMYETSGYRVYGQQQVIPDDFSVGDYYISEERFVDMIRYRVEPNDILISVMGTIGRAAVVPPDVEPGIINPRLVLYRVIERLVMPRYLQCFLNNSTSQRYFSLAAQGTTMEGLNMTSIGELYVALPPIPEQMELLQFIQQEEEKLDRLSIESTRAVTLLKERRSALITAAVTGQIDVRNLTPEIPA